MKSVEIAIAVLLLTSAPGVAQEPPSSGSSIELATSCKDERGNVVADSVIVPPEPGVETTGPVPIEKSRKYPRMEQKGDSCAHGSAIKLRAIVRSSGALCGIELIDVPEGCSNLAREVAKVARSWKFRPATRNGRPVPVRYDLKLTRQ